MFKVVAGGGGAGGGGVCRVWRDGELRMKGPVGWFPDPEGGDGLRYFDGEQWTQIAPPPAAAAPTQPVSVVANTTNTVGAPQQAHPTTFLGVVHELDAAVGLHDGAA